MFGIRVASSMDVNKKMGGKITNAEGLTDEKAWGNLPLGRLRRSGEGQDGRHRHHQPSQQLSLPDDLARANLRACLRPIRSAGTILAARTRGITRFPAAKPSNSATAWSSTKATPSRPAVPPLDCRQRMPSRPADRGREELDDPGNPRSVTLRRGDAVKRRSRGPRRAARPTSWQLRQSAQQIASGRSRGSRRS